MIPFQLVKTANEILMYFRSNKKNGLTVSLNDSIGYDKDGNEISLLEVIKDDAPDITDALHVKENEIGRAHV